MNNICFQCGKIIKTNNQMFRYCDATLCSVECKMMRGLAINKIDPNFRNPQIWSDIWFIPKDEHCLNKNMDIHKSNTESCRYKRVKSQVTININDSNDEPESKKPKFNRSSRYTNLFQIYTIIEVFKSLLIIKNYKYYFQYLKNISFTRCYYN